MGYQFNIDEIFEIAERIERNGADYYGKLAESVSDLSIRILLLDLAAMEAKHEKTFATLRSEMVGAEQSSSQYDPEGEAAQYLQGIADTRVFFEKEMPTLSTSGNRSPEEVMEEVLIAAIQAEKDSIVFYLGVKDLVSEENDKKKIDAIIKEEMTHIRILSTELTNLKK